MTLESYSEINPGDAVVFKEGCDFIRCFVERISYEDNGATKNGLKIFHLKDVSNGEIFEVSIRKDDYAYCPWRFLDSYELEDYLKRL